MLIMRNFSENGNAMNAHNSGIEVSSGVIACIAVSSRLVRTCIVPRITSFSRLVV